jgi:hypothetical protein
LPEKHAQIAEPLEKFVDQALGGGHSCGHE